ncbi:MAG TPA: hypothetical protein VMB05_12170 [Solirubrobacteraceae bacterium]|nr:hypothetical protein [Solirubrobacteraceae bacterium]
MSGSIQVSVTGRRTKITVRDWPSERADWRVSSEKDGRKLRVHGWSNLKPDQPVGELKLHVTRKSLLITGRWVADTLLTNEQPYVLATMVVCAEQIVVELRQAGVGNGCLEWQLEPGDVEYIQRLFKDYEPSDAAKRTLKRGKRYLRKCVIRA